MNIINFKLSGLTCESCVKLVTNYFKKIPGVQEVDINLASGEAKVSSSDDLNLDILEKSLEGTHYLIVK